MIQFQDTKIGRQFLDGTMPRIAKGLEQLCKLLEIYLKGRHAVELDSNVGKLYRPHFDPDPSLWEVGHSESVMHYKAGFQFGTMMMHVTAVRVHTDDEMIQQDDHDGSYLDHLSDLAGIERFTIIEIPGHDGKWVVYFTPHQE